MDLYTFSELTRVKTLADVAMPTVLVEQII
jgi:hypothetical protein